TLYVSVVLSAFCIFYIMRSPLCTLFPYTTLFRSRGGDRGDRATAVRGREAGPRPRPGADPRARGRHQVPGQGESGGAASEGDPRSEEHTSELQSREKLVCRLLPEKKKKGNSNQSG